MWKYRKSAWIFPSTMEQVRILWTVERDIFWVPLLPVGGESTHTIITGHSGMASQKMFTDLEQLREGIFSTCMFWMKPLPMK